MQSRTVGLIMQEPAKYLGRIDCAGLRAGVRALGDAAWLEDQQRQTEFRNVHSETQSIILIFCDAVWPDVTVAYRSGWNLLGGAAAPIMQAIVAAHYPPGGKVLRAVLARLPVGARIGRHRDTHPSFEFAHRIHVPLETNDDVTFIVGTNRILTEVGLAFELNNQLPHQVRNEGDQDRIHFIFDYLPPTAAPHAA